MLRDTFIFSKTVKQNQTSNTIVSDIVIAIGYTTPGFEALSLGKRVIYYSLLNAGGQAFADLPNIVATNEGELKRIFEIIR